MKDYLNTLQWINIIYLQHFYKLSRKKHNRKMRKGHTLTDTKISPEQKCLSPVKRLSISVPYHAKSP